MFTNALKWQFSLSLLLTGFLGACASGTIVAPSTETLGPARVAGLLLYDQLAPTFSPNAHTPLYVETLGAARPPNQDCATRYQAAALQARCSAFTFVFTAATTADNRANSSSLSLLSGAAARVTGGELDSFLQAIQRAQAQDQGSADLTRDVLTALKDDVGNLFALERAARVISLQTHDHAFLEQMDIAFDLANGRRPPTATADRATFELASAQITASLARPAPAYGASSLFAVMSEIGAPLTAMDVATISKAAQAANRSIASFDLIAKEWRAFADAIDAYDSLIKAALQSTAIGTIEGQQAVNAIGLEMLASLIPLRKVRR